MATDLPLRRRVAGLDTPLAAERPDSVAILKVVRDLDRMLRRLGLLRRRETLAARVGWWPVVTLAGASDSDLAALLPRLTGGAAGEAVGADDPRLPPELAAGNSDEAVTCTRVADGPWRGLVCVRRTGGGAPVAALEAADLVLLVVDAEDPDPAAVQALLDGLSAADAGSVAAGRLVCVLDRIDACPTVAEAERLMAAWADLLERSGLPATVLAIAAAPAGDAAAAAAGGPLADFHGAQRAAIAGRLDAVSAARTDRVRDFADGVATALGGELVPRVRAALRRWRRRVMLGDVLWAAVLAGVVAAAVRFGGVEAVPAFVRWLFEARPAWAGGLPVRIGALLLTPLALLIAGHWWLRAVVARGVAATLPEDAGSVGPGAVALDARRVFRRATRFWRSLFRVEPIGWGRGQAKRLARIRATLDNRRRAPAAG